MVAYYGFLSTGKSALHWAAAVNNVEATVALLKNGANKDMQDLKVCSCTFEGFEGFHNIYVSHVVNF